MTKLKTILLTAAITVPVTLAFAGPHSARKHLREAQGSLDRAWEQITKSQQASEWDEGHHAEKAKELIERAKEEIHLAVEYDEHK
jgi:hypothetical protein